MKSNTDYTTELTLLLERILPSSLHNGQHFAGAKKLGIPQYAQHALTAYRHNTANHYFSQAMESLNTYCQQSYTKSFSACSIGQQNTAIQTLLEQQEPYFSTVFQQLIKLALEGMLSDPRHGGNQNEQGWHWMAYQHQEPLSQ